MKKWNRSGIRNNKYREDAEKMLFVIILLLQRSLLQENQIDLIFNFFRGGQYMIKKKFIDINTIEKDDFYKIIKAMPKGCLLHAHYPATTNIVKFINKIKIIKPGVYDQIYYLNDNEQAIKVLKHIEKIVQDNNIAIDFKSFTYPSDNTRFKGKVQYSLSIFTEGPPTVDGMESGWRQLSAESEDRINEILSIGTRMKSIDDYDFLMGLSRLTNLYWSLIKDSVIYDDYFRFTLEEARDDGLQCIELKTTLGGYFEKKPMKIPGALLYYGEWSVDKELEILYRISEEMKNEIYCKIILGQVRGLRERAPKSILDTVESIKKQCNIHKNYPPSYKNLIRGIDLFGDEVKANQNRYYVNTLLDECDLNFYPHGGETEVKGKNYNLSSLIALTETGKKVRVGHGIALARDDALVHSFRQVNIHVETCPLSNYILGYVDTIADHPGKILLNMGVRMSINSDDASVFGYDYVSVDWYYVIRAWNLTLRKILDLCKYSIEDSSLSEEERIIVWNKFKEKFIMWHEANKETFYVHKILSTRRENSDCFDNDYPMLLESIKQSNMSSLSLNHIPKIHQMNLPENIFEEDAYISTTLSSGISEPEVNINIKSTELEYFGTPVGSLKLPVMLEGGHKELPVMLEGGQKDYYKKKYLKYKHKYYELQSPGN